MGGPTQLGLVAMDGVLCRLAVILEYLRFIVMLPDNFIAQNLVKKPNKFNLIMPTMLVFFLGSVFSSLTKEVSKGKQKKKI